MSKQTKLSSIEKAHLRDMRSLQEGSGFQVFHFPERRITVGVRYIPGHNCARVFTSIASPEETKYRKKVGEYRVREAYSVYKDGVNTFAGNPYRVVTDTETHASIAANIAETQGDILR